jgi:NAD(P)-dependent dehydrogenase (short-subunit alcohol dehydrogenase family)
MQVHAMVLNIFRVTELVLPDMQARKWGRIINVASESVVQPIAAIGISNTLRGAILPTLAVWIEAIFLAARPRRSELGLAQVPIGTASAQHAA